MRLRYLLLTAISGLTFCNSIFGQINKMLFSPSADSLAGFDEKYHQQAALKEGLSGADFIGYMEAQRRSYINVRYGFVEHVDLPGDAFNYFRPLGNVASINNAPCVNEDFESGNLSGWTASRGRNTSSQIYPTFTTNISAGSQVSVVTTPLTDPFVGTIPASPLGGTKVVRINNTSTGQAPVIRIQQTFSVTPSNYLYDFAYWAVMQNATSHDCSQTPYMAVRIRNFTGTLQACPNFSIVAPSTGSGGCPGIGPTTWTQVSTSIMTNTGWQKFSIDLTPYMGQNVTVEAYVAHCSLTGHFGYAYFDSHCNTMNLTVNSQTVSLPNTINSATVQCGGTATMTAPGGLGPYLWYGPAGSGIFSVSTTSIITTVPGDYTLNMSPTGICNPPMQKIISLSFVPPTTVAANPATICTSGSNTVSTITASGASNYTWMPGNLNGSSIAVSPASTTIYTVTAQSGTCIGNFTTEVTVAPDPVIVLSASSPTICNGGSTTLTATGGVSYTWMPGNITGSQAIVNPTNTTVYTVTALNAGGCQGSNTIQIGISTTPSVSVFPSVSPTVCANTPVTLVGLGAGVISFSWYPTNPLVVGQVVSVSPSVTTEYTVVGTNGSCTNSAVHTVTVDTGPNMTVTANPAVTCPGISTTLTAQAPSSLGFTWNPGGSTSNPVVVNPASTTVYSVTGINLNGCRSTYTINKFVAPVPAIVFSPANPTACIGSSVLITASGGSSYTWQPGSVTSNTRLVSPAVNTTYSVTASNGTCSSSSTVAVTAIPVPTVNASASPTAICRGNFSFLSASGANNYTWQPNGATNANALVNPTVTTTYTVTGNTAGCSNTSTLTVVVNPLPTITAVANPTAVCPGFCSTITATGASTYNFSGGTVVCPTGNTTYSVSGTSTAGCNSASPATVQVVVNPTPVINITASSTSICVGGSVSLSASGATGYTWNPGNLTTSNIVVSPGSTTTYTVEGVSASGCVGTQTITITVIPNPVVAASASPSPICPGATSTLSASGATTYSWMPGNLSGASPAVSPLTNTTYTVTGNTAGCTGTATVAVAVHTVPVLVASASPTGVCGSNCSTLSASGAFAYLWMPGNISGASAVVCPTGNTTYTLTGTSPFGCSANTTLAVSVFSVPVVMIAPASSASICAGQSQTLVASGASSYTWMPGNITTAAINVNPLSTTIYTVTGRSTNGCSSQSTVMVTVVPNPVVNAGASPATICSGSSSTLTASGAAGYTWMPGNFTGTSTTVSPASTTIYTVTGSSGGCSVTRTVQVTVNPSPTVTAAANPGSICAGASATLTASGAASYVWHPGSLNGSPVVVSPAAGTQYTVTGTSGACSGTAAVNLIVNPLPSIIIASSAPSVCSGSAVTFTASGASAYTWMPGNISGQVVNFNPITSTTYTVIGATPAGCSSQQTVNVVVVPNGTLSASVSPAAICAGQSATISASGGTSYTWMPGNLSGPTQVVSPGITTTYSVFGNSGACPAVPAQITVTVNPLPTVNVSASSPSICAGGTVSLSASGALSYNWNPGSLTGGNITVSPGVTTTYTVTGTGAGACTGQATINIVVVPTPVVNASASPSAICAGSSAMLSASGASSYNWNPGSLSGANVTVSPSSTTIYTVTGSTSGCAGSRTVQVTVNSLPVVTVNASNTNLCAGSCATLSGSGGVSYTYNPGGQTGNSVQVCPSATTIYTITGSNAAGCTDSDRVQLYVFPLPVLSISPASSTICAGQTQTLQASGALSYTWMPGNIVNNVLSVSPLSTTVYSLTGESAAGCTSGTTATVVVNPRPVVTASGSPLVICAGECSTLTASGAAFYSWSHGVSTAVSVVCPTVNTTYSVVGISGAGCSSTVSVVSVSVNSSPTLTASAGPATICSGSSSTLSASGALSYTWMPGNLSGAAVVVSPTATTIYTVTGTNASGCSSSTTLALTVNPAPNVGIVASSNSVCAGFPVLLTGTGAVSYSWQPGGLSGPVVTVAPNVTTTYTVTGTNIFGCSRQATTTIVVVPLPVVSAASTPTAVCIGNCATLTASGAGSYTWFPGNMTGPSVVQCPTVNTTYTVIGQAGLCFNFTTVSIQVNSLPTIFAVANPTGVCPGGTASLSAGGGNTYTWMPGNLNGANVGVIPSGTTNYTVNGTNAAGCSNTAAVTVSVYPTPVITLGSSSGTICAGSSVTLTAAGASTYSWLPGNLAGQAVVVSPASTTIYTVQGFSANGCAGTQTISVGVINNPVVSAGASPPAICSGSCSTLTASGASNYTWSTGNNGSSILVCPPTSSVYMVTGNTAGCSSSATVAVTVNAGPSVSITANPAAICPGGTATLSAGGATSYSWLPGGSTASQITVSPLTTSVYTVQGFSSFGCQSTATIQLVVNPNPTISTAGSANTVCAGQPAQLSASGANTYTWQPGSLSGNPVTVSPLATTVYTVTGSLGSCTASATHTLAVTPLPIITAQANPASICSGSSTTLTASGATGYTWNPGPLTGATVVVNPSANTPYIVSGLSSQGCIGTQTVNVSVNPIPVISASVSSGSICSGSSATLTVSGALSYTWLPGGTNGSVTVVSPGSTTTYTAIGSNGFGCTSTTTITLNVVPTPTVNASTSNASVCQGFTTTLSASGANNYTWMPQSSSQNPNTVTVTATTVYTVTGESNGCTATATVVVNALPLPVITAAASPTSVCQGMSTTLTANGAVNYTWMPLMISGSTVTDTPLSTTDYTVAGFGSNGCPNFTTVNVPVLTVPNLTLSASSPSVCLGSSGTLTASGALNYTWQPGNLSGQSVTVSPAVATTYTVTGDNGACSNTAAISMGVNPLPVISAAISPTSVCEGLPVNLSATGGINYTWMPISVSGATVTDTPTITLTYTVTGDDANGCTNTAMVSVSVNPNPVILAAATPSAMCEGSLVTATLSVSGANSFTWLPSGANTPTITESPSVTTIYTVQGTDAIGCIGTGTVQVGVFTIPTIAVTPATSSICAGSTATLTASGASNYTWLPGGGTSSTEIVSPGSTVTYTIIGDNGGICLDTTTADVVVFPVPSNITATVSGTITCASPSVNLSASSTDTNVSYSWQGPGGFSSSLQNPQGITGWGTYTVLVTDTITGCAGSATVDVATDNSIPVATASAGGSITCATSTVELIATHSTTNAGYSWTGPSGAAGNTQSVVVSEAGTYTVVVTDLSSSCTGSAIVTVGSHTEVAVTATITAATCSAGVSLNDGTIMVSDFGALDKFDLVAGTSYTGSLTYSTAITIPSSGIITSNLANPVNAVNYTLRIFDSLGCVKDVVLTLEAKDCTLRPLGVAKAVSTATTNSDGSYDLQYTIVVKNYDTAAVNQVVVTENLAATLPAPVNFSIVGMQVNSAGGLSYNTAYNGISETSLTSTVSSISAGSSDTIRFTVRVVPNGFFGPFSNSVTVSGLSAEGVTINDLSTNGLEPDPDGDNNPGNNSDPTIISLTPKLFFGLTKKGEYQLMDNKTYDVSYTVTIHNLGNDTLRNVSVTDSLFDNTIKSPAAYSIKSGPTTTGHLAANSNFDGRFDIDLLNVSQSRIAPGEISQVSFVVNVVPDTVTVLINSAYGEATNLTSSVNVADVSNSGDDPDSNNNGIWNEADDNVPTVLVLPPLITHTLFIPEGFSPDGDGINDFFVIKGLPDGGENSLTVFNRWGNKVYVDGNYKNTWSGHSNVSGTFGSNRLPPGTYYYILEIKGSGQKAITGFVVLQY